MLASTPAARLTWYPGSIRPYASLWHTVLRVAALNGLRSGELPDWPTALSPTGQRQRSLYPLHNARAAVNTDALASALGEAPAVFVWSHFGALAPWLRFAVTPGFRLCLACLEEGYHSALFSLRFLSACPIHGTPLLAQCHCGRAFKDRLSPTDLARGQLRVLPAGVLYAPDMPLPDDACQSTPRAGSGHRLARPAVAPHQTSAVARPGQTRRKPDMAQSAVRVQ